MALKERKNYDYAAEAELIKSFYEDILAYLDAYDAYGKELNSTVDMYTKRPQNPTRVEDLRMAFLQKRTLINTSLKRATAISDSFGVNHEFNQLLIYGDPSFGDRSTDWYRLRVKDWIDQTLAAIEHAPQPPGTWEKFVRRADIFRNWLFGSEKARQHTLMALLCVLLLLFAVPIAWTLRLLGFDLRLVLEIIKELKR